MKLTRIRLCSSLAIVVMLISMVFAPLNLGKNIVDEINGTPAGWSDDINLSNSSLLDSEPAFDSNSQNLHIVWRHQGTDVRYINSHDNGTTWEPITTLYSSPATVLDTDIAVSGQNVHILYNDLNGWDGVYYRNSTDGGMVWNPAIRITPSGMDCYGGNINVNNSNLHIIWYDVRDGPDGEIYYRRSLDGGITFDNGQGVDQDRRISFSPSAVTAPKITGTDSNISVAWMDERNGNFEIYFMISKDNGNTWEDGLGNVGLDRRLTFSGVHDYYFDMEGSKIHVAWVNEIWPGPIYKIYYINSTDYGATWSPEKLIVDTANCYLSDITVNANVVHIVWHDWNIDGTTEVYYMNSTDDGTTWNSQTRLTYNEGNYSDEPKIAVVDDFKHIIWTERRDGNREIYYKRFPDFPAIDSESPEINHTPVASANVFNLINITANITDNVSVNSVFLNFTDVHGVNQNITMNKWGSNYSFDIPGQNNIGFVDYFIWCNDTSGNANQTVVYQIQINDITNPEINHLPIASANVFELINITANITDDIAVNKVFLNFTGVNGTNYTVPMNKWDGNYSFDIPGQASPGTVDYFIWANDSSDNDNMTQTYQIQIFDVTDPEINHVPITSANIGETINITANVTDDVNVSSVYLNYTGINGTSYNVSMTPWNGNWSYEIPGQSNTGFVDYFIWANDSSDNDNMTLTYQIQIFDVTDPEINHMSITSANISETINITANVTDDVGVSSVYLNYTDINGASYNVSMTPWNGNWSYEIPGQSNTGFVDYFIWANDTNGNDNLTQTYQIQIFDITDPEINHVPVTSVNVSEPINITANVTDDVSVSSVYLNYTGVNGTSYNVSMQKWNGNYSYEIPGQNTIGNVQYFIWANDSDDNNNRTIEYSIQINDIVKPEINHVPVVSANNGELINITVNVTDDVEVDKVYLNYTGVDGINHNVTMSQWDGNWSYEITGQYNIGVVDYFIWVNDTSGNDNQTQIYQIQINDITKPEIEHTPVTSVNVSEIINITAQITDDVEVDSVYVNYTGIDGNNFNISMIKWNGNWSFEIPGQASAGVIEYFIWCNDTSGNSNQTTVYQVHINDIIIPDTTLPTIISKSPTGVNVSISTTITITFDEPMDKASVQNAITISPTITILSYSWNADNTTLTITPSVNLSYNTTYNITVGIGGKDIAGNSLETQYSWQFTTELQPITNGPDDGGIGEYWWILILFALPGLLLLKRKKKSDEAEEVDDIEEHEAPIEKPE